VLSEDTRRGFLDAGIGEDRVVHIRPGITPLEPLSPDARSTIRAAHELPVGPVVVFPGDYEFSSAAQVVADAATPIIRACPEATIVFACRIKRAPSREIQGRIQQQLQSFGPRVRFVNQVDDMPAFVGAADVVVMPAESLYAKMDVPLVLLEAMSQKVPVVVARKAPLSELLAFEPGLGVPPADPTALAAAVIDILQHPEMAAQYGKNGCGAVRDHFSADVMAKQVENLYDDLLKSPV
jgi:phosphatidylinositol alpha-1,6-mannosyltransferase